MNTNIVWCIARHEMRIHRRLLRTHVFIWAALFICMLYFWGVSLSHMRGASEIPMLGVISPRYILALLGGSFIALFCTGILLLTFDQLNRDENCRIHEVVNSKPISSFELFTGRLCGVAITMAIPMVFFLFAIVLFGLIAETFSFQFGEPVEMWSVVSFICLDITPNFLFFGSMAILFSILLKSRLLAILLTLCCLVSLFWLNSRLPLDISKPLQTVSGNVLFPSELIPTFITPEICFNRLALMLMAVGMLFWSSCVYKRTTPAPATNLIVGTGSFCMGLAVISTMFGLQTLEQNRISQWIETHNEHFEPSSFPDVHEIRGHIEIKPGRTLHLNLTLDVSVNTNQSSEFTLFSFNPGFQISYLAVASENVVDHEFRDGLLKIPSRYFDSDRTELEISAKGHPNKRFAYLDSKDTLSKLVGLDNRQLRLLGTENAIFRSEFVALLPGIKWYPTAGTATNEYNWEHRERDFFNLDVEVSVPRDWIVAGPARRKLSDETDGAKYRFQQSNPLPEFALIASKFESASIEVEGILFEILYSKTHRKTFERFASAADLIRDKVDSMIPYISVDDFRYPFDSFALVAVPSTLRVFGGGTWLDTVMCPPGIVMIRETTLPTLPVHTLIDHDIFERFYSNDDDREHRLLSLTVDAVADYLQHPMFESNLELGFFRHQFREHSSATLDGANALNIFWERLLINSMYPYASVDFDFYLALDRKFLNLASVDLREIFSNYSVKYFSNESNQIFPLQHATLNAPEVWDMVEKVSLRDADIKVYDALTLRAMRLRAHQLAEYISDMILPLDFDGIVVDAFTRFRGKNFVFTDLVAVFAEHDINLVEMSGDLLTKAGLPGFFVSSPSSQHLENDDQSTFETIFVIQNREPVSGPVKLTGIYQRDEDAWRTPFRTPFPSMLVGANQTLRVVIESPQPVETLWIEPYLSKNRMDLRLEIPRVPELQNNEDVNRWKVTINSIEEIEPPEILNSSITIDDLDTGFSVPTQQSTSIIKNPLFEFVRKLLDKSEIALDNGLPKYGLSNPPKTKTWHRWTDPTAHGTYRRTFAISEAGDGSAVVKFNTTLPHVGEWMLEYYLPQGHFTEETVQRHGLQRLTNPHSVGTINLEIHTGSTVIDHVFDAPNATTGWNPLGSFELSETLVDVLVSNKTDQANRYVFADAIRWTPVKLED